MIEKENCLRSRDHLFLVKQLSCVLCDRHGPSDAAHPNFGKGMGIKSCDSLAFPMCRDCHVWLDQSGKLDKSARRRYERSATEKTRAEMLQAGTYAPGVEAAYQKAIKRWRNL